MQEESRGAFKGASSLLCSHPNSASSMRRRHFLAAQAWYGISQGAPAFLNPFLNLYFHRLGLTPSQIGLLSALRPWISAPCGSIIAGLADRWGAHRSLLMAAYLLMTWIQGLMALPVFASFGAMLVLTMLTSTVNTPASIIADAAVMAASTHPGDYGRLRTWASISWSAFAPVAGWVNSSFGIRVGIVCFVVGSMCAVPAAWMLPVEALRRRVAPIIERGLSREAQEAIPLTAAVPEMEQTLLAEEAPPPTPITARHGLTKALAIVRFIETITELGVVPPAGAGMYGYTALPLHYAAQHLAPVEEEAPDLAGSPGYSPFAGGAEPGSESPPFGSSPGALGNGTTTRGTAADEAAAAAPAASPSQPPSLAASNPGSRVVHGSLQSLASLPQRPATMPRPISADNLGRVSSLRAGIPRVRTHPKLVLPEEEEELSSEEEVREEDEEVVSPDLDVVLSPHLAAAREQRQELGEQEEVEMFEAEDLPAAGERAQHASQQPGQLQGTPSASVLLQDIRGIRVPEDQPGPGAAAAGSRAPEPGGGQSSSGELPVSYIPPGQAAAAEPREAATPAYRSAAVQRLAQIFGGRSSRSSRTGAPAAQASTISRGSGGSGADAEAGSPALASASAPYDTAGFTPVRKYLDYRQAKLERKRQHREHRVAAAVAEGREPEPPTPLPSSAAALAGALFGSITPSLVAAAQLPAQQMQQVAPEELREALDLEMQEAAVEHDPTGSMIVGMLSKKLERMAAETRRKQRLRRRADRQAEAAAAAAAAAAPPAGPEVPGGVPVLPPPLTAAPGHEVAEEFGSKEAAAAEAAPRFGASLKRLLGDPQVATFFFLTTLLGFGHGIIGSFLFMYLAQLGSSELLMGYALIANALPELPAFFFFGAILGALGMNTVLLVAATTLGLRIYAYSLLPASSLTWIIPIEALHAVTFACGWSASAVNSSKIAPPGLESTTQGIFQGCWTGIGCGMAGLLGGILYGSHGPEMLFRLSGLVILGGTAAAALVTVALRWRRKHREGLPNGGSEDKLPPNECMPA